MHFTPQHLLTIFGDVILLDTRFCIMGVGRLILTALNYQPDELTGKHINEISNHPDFASSLREQLKNEFFEDQAYTLRTRGGQVLSVSLSGICARATGDAEAHVLLKIKDLQEIWSIHRQLEEKTLELDQFLYRASHDLRGPLATILGLTHVALMEAVPPEQIFYLKEILKYAEKLDDTLKNLLYIANSGELGPAHVEVLSIEWVKHILQRVVRTHGGDQVGFIFRVDQLEVRRVNDIDFISLLKNVLVAILDLPKQMAQQHISIVMTARKSHILINVFATGFKLDDALSEKFKKTYLSCSEVLHSSNLVHFYVARKILHKLRGTLEAFLSEKSQHIFIRIPVPEE